MTYVNTTNIIGTIVLPNDTIREKSTVIFEMTGFDTDADDNAVITPFPIGAQIDATGNIDVDLWPNPDGVRTTFYNVTLSIYNGVNPHLVDCGKISVPSTGGPYDLNDLLPVSPPSGASVDDYIAFLAAAVASAESAADNALASEVAAEAAAASVYSIYFTDKAAAEVANITATTGFVYLGAGDQLRMFIPVASEPFTDSANLDAAKFQSANGLWFQMSPVNNKFHVSHFGALPHIVCDPITKAWYDACAVKPTYNHLMHVDIMIREFGWRDMLSKITGIWGIGNSVAVADAGHNIRNAGTFDATIHGAGTYIKGVGYEGNNTDAYISFAPWSDLIAQDAAFIGISYIEGDSDEYGNMVSSVDGASSGVSFKSNSSAGGSVQARLNNSTATSKALGYRHGGFYTMHRNDAAEFSVNKKGDKWNTSASVSTAVTTNTASFLRSGSDYTTDTARMLVTGNGTLDRIQEDALDVIMRWFVEGLPAVVGRGPSCESIGFTALQTPAVRTAAMNAAAEFGSRMSSTVVIGEGTYLVDEAYHGFSSNLMTEGASRNGSIIRLDTTASKESNLLSPPHDRGGERGAVVRNLTLDGATSARGITDTGVDRPSGSLASFNGSQHCVLEDFNAYDPTLHSADICNTGETNDANRRYYSIDPDPSKLEVGVRAKGNYVRRMFSLNATDDHVTAHYADGGGGKVEHITAYWSSGRHPDGEAVTMAVEIDDGAMGFDVDHVYAHGLARGVAAKSHTGHHSPKFCSFKNITTELTAQGAFFYDPNNLDGGGHSISGLNYSRPAQVHPNIEALGLYVEGITNFFAKDLIISAIGNEAYLEQAVYISSASKKCKVDGFLITNWISDPILTDGETVRVTSSCSDITVVNGAIEGAGKFGLWDSGSDRPHYSNITFTGTDVADSVGFKQSGTPEEAFYSDIDVVSGFTTETEHLPTHNVTLDDDTFVELDTPPNVVAGVITVINTSSNASAVFNAMFFYDAGGSPSVDDIGSGSQMTVTTGPLNGTTGIDGEMTVSIDTGKMYLENRNGDVRSYRIEFSHHGET